MNKLDFILMLYTLGLVSILSLGALTSGFSTTTIIVLLLLLPLYISLSLDILRTYYIWKYRHNHISLKTQATTPRSRLIAFFLASLLLGSLIGRFAFFSSTTASQIALEQ